MNSLPEDPEALSLMIEFGMVSLKSRDVVALERLLEDEKATEEAERRILESEKKAA